MNATELKRLMNIPLSDTQILNLVGGQANLIMYPDMHKMKSVDELLEPHGACIILYESKPSYGHWTALIKLNRNEIEFFNSYGDDNKIHEGIPDAMLGYIPKAFRDKSFQNHTYLAKLMVESPYNLSYNQYNFQKDGEFIKTCGRHVGTRINMKNLSLDEYKRTLDKYCKEFNTDYDGAVSIITKDIN